MFIRTSFINLFMDSMYKRRYRKVTTMKGFYRKYHQGTRRMRTKIPQSGYGNRSDVIGKVMLNDASRNLYKPQELHTEHHGDVQRTS